MSIFETTVKLQKLDAEEAKELIGIVRGTLLTYQAPVEVMRSFEKLVDEHYRRRAQAEIDNVSLKIFDDPEAKKKPDKSIGSVDARVSLNWSQERREKHGERVKQHWAKRRAEKAQTGNAG